MTANAVVNESVRLVVMGVAGCGKSSLGALVASELGGAFIEGDEHHPIANAEKMRQGIALDDGDRWPWLEALGGLLAAHPGPLVLTCSSLKRSYRQRLRARVPGLRFVFVEIDLVEATRRVSQRPGHLFPPKLVASQFLALETPLGEAGVLGVSATLPAPQQVAAVTRWLKAAPATALPLSISSLS